MQRSALCRTLPVLLLTVGLALPIYAFDDDGDGVSNATDNCVEISNPDQVDSDADGCGNACDADYDQSGIVDADDFDHFRSVMGRKEGDANFDARADHDDDGRINGTDFVIFRSQMNREPGPSLDPQRDRQACP